MQIVQFTYFFTMLSCFIFVVFLLPNTGILFFNCPFFSGFFLKIEPTLATAIQENLGIPCRSDETIREITRGIRAHFIKFVKPLAGGGLEQAQLGLGHSYSRGKVKKLIINNRQ